MSVASNFCLTENNMVLFNLQIIVVQICLKLKQVVLFGKCYKFVA